MNEETLSSGFFGEDITLDIYTDLKEFYTPANGFSRPMPPVWKTAYPEKPATFLFLARILQTTLAKGIQYRLSIGSPQHPSHLRVGKKRSLG